ncbi:MAG TPA: hypothetical protein VNC50_08740, partial [Planctomycetia bacterium]|nr:hypothetical protein [Planctomycetia bacterium]
MSASRLTQWGVTIAAWAAAGAWAGDVAQVPETLKADAAYTTYSKAIVQLDLLANPATAGLPIVIESALPGVLDVRGSVPTSRLKNHVLQSTLRISGLRVRETLRVAPTPRAKEGLLDGKERLALERSTKETIEALFPELKEKIQTSVGRDGIVVCNGECPNYETRLLLAQAMKSQPGCAAVVTLMTIPALPGSQRIPVPAETSISSLSTLSS